MAMIGQHLPIVTMSAPIPGHRGRAGAPGPDRERLPLLRDPDVSYYLRQERSGFILGPYEWRRHADVGRPAYRKTFAFKLWNDDLERLETYIEAAMARVPLLASAGVRRVVNGPIPYSPDGNPYIGPEHGLRNFFHANTLLLRHHPGRRRRQGACRVGDPWRRRNGTCWLFDPPSLHRLCRPRLHESQGGRGLPKRIRRRHTRSRNALAGRPLKTSSLYARAQGQGCAVSARAAAGSGRSTLTPRGGSRSHTLSLQARTKLAERRRCRGQGGAGAVGVLDLAASPSSRSQGPGAAAMLGHSNVLAAAADSVASPRLRARRERGRVLSEFTITRTAAEDASISSRPRLRNGTTWTSFSAALPSDGSPGS